MANKQKIIIGGKVITRRQLFEEKEKYRKIQAALAFEEKIKALIELQKIARNWGGNKNVIIWA